MIEKKLSKKKNGTSKSKEQSLDFGYDS
jgi:hypothetical protein